MRMTSSTMATTLALLLCSAANAQPISQRSPIEQAKSYASLVRTTVGLCPIVITNLSLALRLKQLDPQNPLGKTPREVAAELDSCAKKELVSLPTLKAERVDKNAASIPEKCKVALDELHISVMVHFENFAAEPSEPLPMMDSRVGSESSQLRNQASRVLLLCGT